MSSWRSCEAAEGMFIFFRMWKYLYLKRPTGFKSVVIICIRPIPTHKFRNFVGTLVFAQHRVRVSVFSSHVLLLLRCACVCARVWFAPAICSASIRANSSTTCNLASRFNIKYTTLYNALSILIVDNRVWGRSQLSGGVLVLGKKCSDHVWD